MSFWNILRALWYNLIKQHTQSLSAWAGYVCIMGWIKIENECDVIK